MSARLADFLWRWRFVLSGFIVVGAVAFAPRANITRIDNDISAWFAGDDPVYRDYERLRDEFGGSRTLIIAIKADSADRLFSRPTLDFIRQVTGDIERVDTVDRVASFSTATTVEALERGDGIDVRPLLEQGGTQTPEDVRRRALKDDLIRGDLVSDDGTVTAIVVSFDEARIDKVRAGVIQQIHNLVDPRLPEGVRAYYNGSLEISETYNRITLANQRVFTPPIFIITLIAVYVAFRSWRKMLLTIVAIGISVLWTLGLYALLGYTYNVLTSMLVPLVVVLAIADDVHIMQRWDEERRHASAEASFKRTVAHLAAPLLAASGTTALGMLSLATSPVVAVQSFGVGSAVGIMVDFMISLVFVPTALSLMKPETAETPHEKYLIEPMRRIAMFSTRRPGLVLVLTAAIGLLAALGIRHLRVDTNHINFFSASHPLGQSARVIDNQLSGIYSFQILLEGPPDSLGTPDNLERMNRLANDLRQLPDVKKVRSVADYVRRVNKELNDGDPAADVIPSDPAAVAQELFVFTLGSEGRRELERVVTSDYSKAQIDVKLRSMSSDVVLELIDRSHALASAAFAGTGVTPTTTGAGRLFSTLDHYLVESQISSFGTAFFTVFGVIFIVFRSFRFGFLTIAPNLLPVLAVLGAMGFLGISVNIATVMVASVALGIVDDDTIHFINRYRRDVAAGASTDEAIESATVHEGRASLTTAVINSLAFGVLLLSEYKPTAWFGGLLGLTMAVAFLAEVFILPATIKVLPTWFGAEALRRTDRKPVAA
jgi:predicted RND superfamily exporter protein